MNCKKCVDFDWENKLNRKKRVELDREEFCENLLIRKNEMNWIVKNFAKTYWFVKTIWIGLRRILRKIIDLKKRVELDCEEFCENLLIRKKRVELDCEEFCEN